MKTLIALVILAPLAVSAAEPVEKLMEAQRCYACHDSTKALIGPPWQAVAARHGNNKSLMIDVLARKIVRGGGGVWGDVPMVPNQFTSIEDARAMATWILNQQPAKQ